MTPPPKTQKTSVRLPFIPMAQVKALSTITGKPRNFIIAQAVLHSLHDKEFIEGLQPGLSAVMDQVTEYLKRGYREDSELYEELSQLL